MASEPYLLWRAVDQHGIELDILLQERRDKSAAKRFFKRVLTSCGEVPRKIVTDQLRSYIRPPKRRSPNWQTSGTCSSKPALGSTTRAENSHQPTRERERRMRGFRVPDSTQASFVLFRIGYASSFVAVLMITRPPCCLSTWRG
ncbi:DDE-type integrase/transposase/recombinase [Paraburkholderia sp. WC7.3g]|uniref:DDE-type integrase/transposase/recombinase n=1 Tax=Paraburkholderia sp. WC7.3g TaxID=2991070 RepID=UPI003D197F91